MQPLPHGAAAGFCVEVRLARRQENVHAEPVAPHLSARDLLRAARQLRVLDAGRAARPPVYTCKVLLISNCSKFPRCSDPRISSGIRSKVLFMHGGTGVFINRRSRGKA